MVGDKWIDLECGWNAGVAKSFLVRTGYGAAWKRRTGRLGPAVSWTEFRKWPVDS